LRVTCFEGAVVYRPFLTACLRIPTERQGGGRASLPRRRGSPSIPPPRDPLRSVSRLQAYSTLGESRTATPPPHTLRAASLPPAPPVRAACVQRSPMPPTPSEATMAGGKDDKKGGKPADAKKDDKKDEKKGGKK